MVRTLSTMLPLGTPIPEFELPEANTLKKDLVKAQNNFISDKTLNDQPVLMMIICAHCPFVKHIEPQLTSLGQDYGSLVQIIAVSSNSLITHPQDGPENLLLQAEQNNWEFPYLFDADQSLAISLKAACTPDFFVFAKSGTTKHLLKYRGQLDESRPGNQIALTGNDLRDALDAVLQGKDVFSDQKPSIGCNIKWHPGKEPVWFG